MEEKFCKYCGNKIHFDAVVCTHCGRQVEELKIKQEKQGMLWFNFVGKFLLVGMAILNTITHGISTIKYVEEYNPFGTDIVFFGLLIVEMLLWVLLPMILFVEYKSKDKSFPLFMIVWELLVTEYLITTNIVLASSISSLDSGEFTTLITKIISFIIIAAVNITYFYKRLNVFKRNEK